MCASSTEFASVALSCVLGTVVTAQCPGWLPGDPLPGLNGDVLAAIEWDADGAGPLPPVLVVGGEFGSAGGRPARSLATWDGQVWQEIGGGTDGTVNDLRIYHGMLVVAGHFSKAGGTPAHGMAIWDGKTWTPFPVNSNESLTEVHTLTEHYGSIIAAGNFNACGFDYCEDGIMVWNPSDSKKTHIALPLKFYTVDHMWSSGGQLFVLGRTDLGRNTVITWSGAAWSAPDTTLTFSNVTCVVVHQGIVYAGGSFFSEAGDFLGSLASWSGSAWTFMGAVQGMLRPEVASLVSHSSGLFASGAFYEGYYRHQVARWSGTDWDILDDTDLPVVDLLAAVQGRLFACSRNVYEFDGDRWHLVGAGFDGPASALSVYRGEVVFTGNTSNVGPINARGIVRWDGAGWSSLECGLGIGGQGVSLRPWHESLIVLGEFSEFGGGPGEGLAKWSSSGWQQFASYPTWYGSMESAVDWNGQLVIGGSFQESDSVANGVARWNDPQWEPLGVGLGGTVRSLCTYRNMLIAGGYFRSSGDGSPLNCIAQWDGTEWKDIGGGMPDSYASVTSLLPYRDDLIAAGRFTHAGTAACEWLARWDGTAWGPIASGVGHGPYDGVIGALAVYHDKLIVAGEFTGINGVAANNIASWDGTTWRPLGSGLDARVFGLGVYHDELVVCGGFKNAGGRPSTYWARWSDTGAPWIARQPEAVIAAQSFGASFRVAPASGFPELKFRWRRNGQAIADGPGGASVGGGWVSGATSATLDIADTRFSDAGDYDCVIIGSCGSAASQAAHLSVVCLADADANGFVNGVDFDTFILAFELGDPAADADRNGWVNGEDFDAFVAAFEAGC